MADHVPVFPDPEPLMRQVLLQVVPAGVPVATRIPRDRPVRMLRYSHVGGARSNLVQDSPRFVIDAWGPDADAARLLADLVREHLEFEENISPLFWEEDAGPFPYPDPDVTDWVRFQQVGVLTVPAGFTLP